MEQRVSVKNAARELGVSELTVRGLLQEGKLDIGYALKHENRWSYFIWRKPLDDLKAKLGLRGGE